MYELFFKLGVVVFLKAFIFGILIGLVLFIITLIMDKLINIIYNRYEDEYMAYSDYGAFVFKNGTRRTDKEDVAVFATDEETFGEPSDNVPSGVRIFASLIHNQDKKYSSELEEWVSHIHHGVMGDDNIRVMCHKQGLPSVYEIDDDGNISMVDYGRDQISDYYEYSPIHFEYKGYKFDFFSDSPYVANMEEPDGTKWKCEYDYGYGAGFEE